MKQSIFSKMSNMLPSNAKCLIPVTSNPGLEILMLHYIESCLPLMAPGYYLCDFPPLYTFQGSLCISFTSPFDQMRGNIK